MRTPAFKLAALSALFAVGTAASSSAMALGFVTKGLIADTSFTVSDPATSTLEVAGIKLAPLGTASQLDDVVLEDGFRLARYNFPVTKADISVTLFPNLVRANTGETVGAALRIYSSRGGNTALANFSVDFKTNVMTADILDFNAKTTEKAAIYTLEVSNPQKTSLAGFQFTLTAGFKNMVLTPDAVKKLGDGLKLPEVLRTPLATLDWGTLSIVTTLKARKPALSGKPYTLADYK